MTDITIDGIATWLSDWFQEKLVSGTNLKTINNQSLLGSGNISISGGGGLSIDDVYPIGSIYMSANNVDPSTLFGGTWQRIEDKFLLAKGSTYSTLEDTGGSADAIVVEHTHTQNQHRHELTGSKTGGMSSGDYLRVGYGSTKASNYTEYSTPTINATGEDGTGKNMPPYFVVNIWKRTA